MLAVAEAVAEDSGYSTLKKARSKMGGPFLFTSASSGTHTAEDLVGDGLCEAGVVFSGDAVAEEDNLVADADAGDGGDIDHGQVHGDTAYDCGLVF